MRRLPWVLAGLCGSCAAPLPPAPTLTTARAPIEIRLEPRPAPVSTATVSLTALSIEQAVLLTLDNDRDLGVQRLMPVVAGTFERIERGVFDPELFADFEYYRERASQTARATGERFDVSGEQSDAVLGVRQRLPTGTEVEASVSHGFDVSDRTPEQHEARVGLTVTQSLLRGFGPRVNLVRLRQATLETEASLFELKAFAQSLVAETELAYWTYVLATEEIAIYTRALEVARQEADDIQQRIEVGQLAELNGAAALAEVALREQARIDAESRRELARLRLVRRLRPDPEGRLGAAVTTISPVRMTPEPLTQVDERCELAMQWRPELGEARLRLRQDRLETVVTKNGLLPRLDVFVALGKTGFDTGLSSAFGAFGGPTYDVRAGLSLGYFLGHRTAAARDVAARVSVSQRRLAIENLEGLVRLEVRLAATEVERARAQIQATATTRRLQAKAARAEKERFAVGTGTALSVARAQRDLLATQIAEVRARVDYRSALVRLYLAEGTLLARRGLVLDSPEG